MAVVNVDGVVAVGFPVNTTVTTANEVGGTATYVALANVWYGVPYKEITMTVSPAGDVLCMLAGTHLKKASSEFVQVMTVDQVRVSV